MDATKKPRLRDLVGDAMMPLRYIDLLRVLVVVGGQIKLDEAERKRVEWFVSQGWVVLLHDGGVRVTLEGERHAEMDRTMSAVRAAKRAVPC